MKMKDFPEAFREYKLANEVIIIDGQPGCGKTLFTSIISAMPRVELLQYSAVLENICALYYLNKITRDGARAMLQIEFDLILYETMMSRNTNFRPSDLSSAFKDVKSFTYLKRLFEKGDENVPGKILAEQPILNFATHNLLGFSDILMSDVIQNLFFIEIVRHPLYMIIQQSLNYENWSKKINTARQFHLYISKGGESIPYYYNDFEIDFLSLNPIEKAIFEIDFMTQKRRNLKNKISL